MTLVMKNIVILGAGVGGLSAGYYLARTGKFNVTVLEKEGHVGGICSSFKYGDYTLDFGAHKLYSIIPGIMDEIENIMQDRIVKIPKRNMLFLQKCFVDYPLKLGNLVKSLGFGIFLKIGSGYGLAILKGLFNKKEPRSYEEFIISRFGKPAYHLIFEPLADKVWGEPSTLHPNMAKTRVPVSGGMEIILKLLGIKKETAETNAEYFYYPKKGFGDFPDTLKEKIEIMGGNVLTSVSNIELETEGNIIKNVRAISNGQGINIKCDYLISAIYLKDLGNMLFKSPNKPFREAVGKLEFRHVVLVYLILKKEKVLEAQWIFFPEKKYLFSRIFEQKLMNTELGPSHGTSLCCDFTCDDKSPVWRSNDETIINKCIEGLVEGGLIRSDEITGSFVKRFVEFYPRYDLDYIEKLKAVKRALQVFENLLLTGRIGMYNYNNVDHCLDMGKFIAEGLDLGKEPRHIWDELEDRVSAYRIVD